jgi:hypothetical protein
MKRLLPLLLLVSAPCFSVEVYQWTDENGKKHFSEEKPEHSNYKTHYIANTAIKDLPFRSDESIRKSMDTIKGKLFAIYNEELRNNKTTGGKLTVKLSINAEGKVIECSVLQSDLSNRTLQARLLHEIEKLNFGNELVRMTVISYSLDFIAAQ